MRYKEWLDKKYDLFDIAIVQLIGGVSGILVCYFSQRLYPDQFLGTVSGAFFIIVFAIVGLMIVKTWAMREAYYDAIDEAEKILQGEVKKDV